MYYIFSHGYSSLEDVVSMAMNEYEPGRDPRQEESDNQSHQETSALRKFSTKRRRGHSKILIGVTASRKFFASRVAEIMRTWGNVDDDGISIRFFVGDLTDKSASYASGSEEDISNLSKQAGIRDLSTIVVMPGVIDDEYPLVGKAASVIKHLAQIVAQRKKEGTPFHWIMDVDDDTYVNLKYLQTFVKLRSYNANNYLGQRGVGKAEDQEMLRASGLAKPYCMGGPGFIMSRSTLKALADNIDSCIEQASQTKMTLLDDVIIGICVHRETGQGCWDKSSYRENTFAHNYRGDEHFLDDSELTGAVTLHAFKEPGLMLRMHERFQRLS
jgi:hypothetical protein